MLTLSGKRREKRVLDFLAEGQVYFTLYAAYYRERGITYSKTRLEIDHESFIIQEEERYYRYITLRRELETEIFYKYEFREALTGIFNRKINIPLSHNLLITLKRKYSLEAFNIRWEVKVNGNLFGKLSFNGMLSFKMNPYTFKIFETDHPQWKFIAGLCFFLARLDVSDDH